MSSSPFVWFLEPIGEQTNAAIARFLDDGSGEHERRRMLAEDGDEHNVWEVTANILQQIHHSRQENDWMSFWVYQARRGERRMRLAPNWRHQIGVVS